MNLKELLENRKIESVEKEEFNAEPSIKDLTSAEHNFKADDYEWALSIAYNAVLRASKGVMQSLGYRAVGKEHHKNTFEFLRTQDINSELVDYFDNVRKIRNKFIYGIGDSVTKENAEETIEKAKEFVQEIRTFVLKIRTENIKENNEK